MTVFIRHARADDGRLLADIGFLAWRQAVVQWGEDYDMLADNARRAFDIFTRDLWSTILVAEQDHALAGWGARENRDNRISDLWIDPRYQRQGIGSALLSALEDEIAAIGYETATVDTHARNAIAIALYRKAGYAVTAFSVKYSAALDRDIEKVDLRKELA